MNTYRRPMKNLGIIEYKKEKKKRYISFSDIFDLILYSLIIGFITGMIITIICLINV